MKDRNSDVSSYETDVQPLSIEILGSIASTFVLYCKTDVRFGSTNKSYPPAMLGKYAIFSEMKKKKLSITLEVLYEPRIVLVS